jgi:hypothetical protein
MCLSECKLLYMKNNINTETLEYGIRMSLSSTSGLFHKSQTYFCVNFTPSLFFQTSNYIYIFFSTFCFFVDLPSFFTFSQQAYFLRKKLNICEE